MKCANCEHPVTSHALDGCDYSGQGRDSCACPFEYDRITKLFNGKGRPSISGDKRCRCCGHGFGWHHEGGDARCSRCEACDGFLDENVEYVDTCGAWDGNANDWRCRRKEGHDGAHARDATRWPHTVAIYPERKNVNYEDAVANPDRTKAADRQVGGDHYMQTGIQPWEIWKAYGLDPWQAGIIKYILRAGRKENVPALQDYEKARHYLDYLIEREKEGESD